MFIIDNAIAFEQNHVTIHAKTLDNFAHLCYHGKEPENM